MRRQEQRGFALLIVFLLAAAVALMLYQQMPRVAFESERDKEQLLIDRGEQYKRAVQLYYIAFKRYPARIEDLENTNDKRFLRRRYVDPYTGKDEWRLIHTNGMYLTDSLVQKPPANPANGPGSTQTNAANASPTGTAPAPVNPANPTDPNAPPQVNAAVAARPSDRPLVQNASFTGNTAGGFGQPGVNPADPNSSNPASFPPLTLFPNGYNASSQPGQPGQPRPGQPGVGQPGFPQAGLPQNGLPQQPGFPQGGFPQTGLPQPGLPQPGLVQPGALQPGGIQPALFQGALPQPPGTQGGIVQPNPNGLPPGQQSPFPPLPGQPNQLGGLNPNFANQSPQPPTPPQYTIGPGGQFVPNPAQQQPQGQPAFPNPAGPAQPGAAPNQALNLINQLLTTPRQPPPGVGGPSTNQTVGGGIAGVASTYTGPTIKSYGDRTQFQEWEFVFQLQQQGLPGQPGAPGQQGAPVQPSQPVAPGQPTPPGLPAMPFGTGQGTPPTRP